MELPVVLSLLLFTASATAQNDLLSSIISEAQSFASSFLAPITGSTTSTSSTSPSSSSTTSDSSSKSTSATTSSSLTSSTSASSASTNSASASPTSSPSITSPSPTAAAQSSSTAAANHSSSGDGSSNTLAIVLGCTLGALAIAAFLALLFFCLRRRRKHRNSAKHRAISPDDDEVESWRHEKPRIRSGAGVNEHSRSFSHGAVGAPLMAEHDSGYPHHQHQNPFVPVPPPARRSGSRAGLNDNTSYSAHPFSPDHVHTNEHPTLSAAPHERSHHALAAGLGGAALGGLAAHAKDRHDRKRSTSRGRNGISEKSDPAYSEDEHNTLPEAAIVDRRSSSLGRVSAKEPWPFMDAHSRKSLDSSRSRNRSLSRSHDQFATPDQHPTDSHQMPSGVGLVGAAAAGGLAGAAIARKSKSQSPHRRGILKQTNSETPSDPSSLSSDRPRTASSTNPGQADVGGTGPHELDTTDLPPTPATKNRRISPIGMAAPVAAAAAFSSRRRSSSSSESRAARPRSMEIPSSELKAPIVPSRSPKRTSLDSRARYSSINDGTAELSADVPTQQLVSPPLESHKSTEHDGLISPVSPMETPQSGSWSHAQAEHLGMAPVGSTAKTASQESTAVGSPSHDVDSSSLSDNQSSGLVSAIQRIFSSQKAAWANEEDNKDDNPSTHRSSQYSYNEDDERRFSSVPRRKPMSNRINAQYNSQYGDIGRTSTGSDAMPGAFLPESHRQEESSVDRTPQMTTSMPPRDHSRGNSFSTPNNIPNTSAHDFAPVVSSPIAANGNRPRTTSRPGYGIGSGDPFDLARVRTDSSMTGISLMNYQEPSQAPVSAPPATNNRPRSWRQSSGSGSDSKEPTLADLRREVLAEDRERARQSWRKSHSRERSGSLGLRYGDDRDLFDLVDQTTGSGRFYAEHGRTGSVGRAY